MDNVVSLRLMVSSENESFIESAEFFESVNFLTEHGQIVTNIESIEVDSNTIFIDFLCDNMSKLKGTIEMMNNPKEVILEDDRGLVVTLTPNQCEIIEVVEIEENDETYYSPKTLELLN